MRINGRDSVYYVRCDVNVWSQTKTIGETSGLPNFRFGFPLPQWVLCQNLRPLSLLNEDLYKLYCADCEKNLRARIHCLLLSSVSHASITLLFLNFKVLILRKILLKKPLVGVLLGSLIFKLSSKSSSWLGLECRLMLLSVRVIHRGLVAGSGRVLKWFRFFVEL